MHISIHPSAVVDDGALIGPGTRVWHFTHICAGARVGAQVSVGQNVFIAAKAVVGDRCKIQNNVSIYDGVTLEDDVFCGPGVVFTNVYNPRAHIERKHEYRPTRVMRGATLGANCTIVCGVTIGRGAFVAAGAVINRDVPDHALMAGVPARQLGWISDYGERLPLPVSGHGQARCPHTGTVYLLENNLLTRQDASHDGLHRSQDPAEAHS
ncbi:MAG TPA: acyltransferase [Burkholderiaceae bacterium]|nr:acyltransferase [Burkholderiaceae bacterium]